MSTSVPAAITVHKLPLQPRLLTVRGVSDLTPRLRRVRFDCDQLANFVTLAPDDHVKLVFSRTADGAPACPTVVDDRWVGGRELITRDYTIRAVDCAAGWVDIDFVVHDHGVAGKWAGSAQAGDELYMLGPRGSVVVGPVFDHYVLACDETALPAVARWLTELPAEVSVQVFAEVTDAADEIALPSAASVAVSWLHRGSGRLGAGLATAAVLALPPPVGVTFWWVAGESLSIKPARAHFKRVLGLDRDHYDVDGYWRLGVADHDHHVEDD